MESDFWFQRWEKNEIGFHEAGENPQLVKYFSRVAPRQGMRVFLPLCGKTRDIGYLLSAGYKVAGVELSERAVIRLFEDLNLRAKITRLVRHTKYSAPGIDIFVGDIFELTSALLGPVAAVYDRAALVALPEEMRRRYAAHLLAITGRAPQLLICYHYDQRLMDGPPFSVDAEELALHYGACFNLSKLDSLAAAGPFNGRCAALENVWLLAAKKQ